MIKLLRLGFATTAMALWATGTGCAADAPLGSRADNNTNAGGGSSTDPEGSGGATTDAAAPRGTGGVARGTGGIEQGPTPAAGGSGNTGSGAQPGDGAGGACICIAIGCGIGTHSVMVPGQCCPVCESCKDVACDLKGCADGTEPVTLPGECCPSMCAPVSSPTACNDGSGRNDCCPRGFDIGTPCAVEDASCLSPCKEGVRTRRICMTVWRQGEEIACEP
jgi:hypothetical protein